MAAYTPLVWTIVVLGIFWFNTLPGIQLLRVSTTTRWQMPRLRLLQKEDQRQINRIVREIKRASKVTNKMLDAYHFVLSVDKIEHINVYGEDEKVNKLLKILLNYLPRKADKCEFFDLFKNSLRYIK